MRTAVPTKPTREEVATCKLHPTDYTLQATPYSLQATKNIVPPAAGLHLLIF